MNEYVSDILVVAHFAWAAFMIGGFFLALIGIFNPRLRRWLITRTIHVCGIIVTASVPLWSQYCPLTAWEYSLRGGAPPQSFLGTWAHRLLYLDISRKLLLFERFLLISFS